MALKAFLEAVVAAEMTLRSRSSLCFFISDVCFSDLGFGDLVFSDFGLIDFGSLNLNFSAEKSLLLEGCAIWPLLLAIAVDLSKASARVKGFDSSFTSCISSVT